MEPGEAIGLSQFQFGDIRLVVIISSLSSVDIVNHFQMLKVLRSLARLYNHLFFNGDGGENRDYDRSSV